MNSSRCLRTSRFRIVTWPRPSTPWTPKTSFATSIPIVVTSTVGPSPLFWFSDGRAYHPGPQEVVADSGAGSIPSVALHGGVAGGPGRRDPDRLLAVRRRAGKGPDAQRSAVRTRGRQLAAVRSADRDADHHLHAADRRRLAVRGRSDRFRRRTSSARDDGGGSMAAAALCAT